MDGARQPRWRRVAGRRQSAFGAALMSRHGALCGRSSRRPDVAAHLQFALAGLAARGNEPFRTAEPPRDACTSLPNF